MTTKLLLLAVVLLVVCETVQANPGKREKRVRRVPLQRDESVWDGQEDESAGRIHLSLYPSGTVNKTEKDSITLQCDVINKPIGSQIQWYYIVRSGDGQSFENFTILANEDSTINNNKYHVWTTAGDKYSLQVNNLKPADSGEYCCFLFISYAETYREITVVNVKPEQEGKFDLNRIIEEVVEEDMEAELGKKLNMTLIRNNQQAQTLIHNAAEEIKSLLHINQSDVASFQNDSARWTVTRKMNGMSSQVKTVVTSLLSQMSSVDSTLARALTPAGGMGSTTYVSYAGQSNKVPDWKRIYNEYKERVDSEDEADQREEERPTILNSVPPYGEDHSDSNAERERLEETHNTVEIPATSSNPDTKEQQPSVHKCQYQLVINEFDPNQCPSINYPRPAAAAARYYEEDNRATAIQTPAVEMEQLTRLENRLIDEMVNAKMVNQTVNMHDSMLQRTEKMLEQQTGNLTSIASTIQELKGKLQRSEEEKRDMEDKLTEVMVNILEVNKRLDVALSRTSKSEPFAKVIGVESAPDSTGCDRHPNVTHYQDCADAQLEGHQTSGVYYIRPLYSACPIPVWCDMETYPAGWTVVQRREGGKVNFNKDWDLYRKGFGEVTGEHWLGNDNLFLMSNQAEYMLRVDLWDFYGSRVYSEYRIFRLEGERDSYRLTIGNYSGTAGDGLKTHNRQKFSTPDRDGDMWEDYHCALEWEGGWWFTNCWSSYLNGRYYNVSDPPYNGISWREWKEEQLYKDGYYNLSAFPPQTNMINWENLSSYTLKYFDIMWSEMKIRPVWSAARSHRVEDEELIPEMDSEEAFYEGSYSSELQNDQPRHAQRHPVSHKLNRAPLSKWTSGQ